MKKLIRLLLLPLMAVFCLVGCGSDKTIADVKKLYEEMKTLYVVEEENIFFSNTDCPYTISINYSSSVNSAMENSSPTTDTQKRYVGLKYQQNILNYIFNYYEKNQEIFYRVLESKDIDKKEISNLYSSLETLKTTLEDFKAQYELFNENTLEGLSDVMEFSVINYTYQVNKVIDASFDFIYNFIEMNEKYSVEDISLINATNLSLNIERAYVDIAYVVYMENVKSLNYSVGSRGVCDLSSIVNNANDYNLIDNISDTKSLSSYVTSNLSSDETNYNHVMNLVNNFRYSKDIFNQRINNYKKIYSEQDFYTLNQHRFGLVSGVEYSAYLNTLSVSERSNVSFIELFIDNTFTDYIEKLNTIVE